MDPETPLWQTLDQQLSPAGMRVLGGLWEADSTLYLIGPDGAQFWPVFQASTEYLDGAPDPVDRYSTRTLTAIAAKSGSKALFPFGGPPYQPFVEWALRSNRCFQSPVQLLVHAELGLFTSFRGALRFSGRHTLPSSVPNPCNECEAKPCLSACPADALNQTHYNVALCHEFLDTKRGDSCMARGCAVRRTCPVGQGQRLEAQSAFHMGYFHKRAAQ